MNRPTAGIRWWGPGPALTVVIALVYANQVLVTVYVTAVHGGDVSFVSRYLPSGWFDLPTGPFWTAVGDRWPAPELLAPSVLHVQAALELPFVILSCLLVARWCDGPLLDQLTRPVVVWAACLIDSATFAAVELSLDNPWTATDLVLRACSAVLTPLLVGLLPRSRPDGVPAVDDLVDLVLFFVATAGLGAGVLVVYDTALLYNLAHLPAYLPIVLGSAAAMVLARWAARRRRGAAADPRSRPGARVAVVAVRRMIAAGFVLALPLRYALVYVGSRVAPAVAVVGLVLVVGSAVWTVARTTLRVAPVRVRRWWPVELAAAAAAAMTAAVLVRAGPSPHTEWRMLIVGSVALGVCVAVLSAGDALLIRGQPMIPGDDRGPT